MKFRVIGATIGAMLLTVSGPAEAQTRKNFLSLSGGIHQHLQSGETGEYVLGENDFPVVPAHLGPLFGFSYLRLGKKIGWEVEARYVGSKTVDLEDPSDGDVLAVTAGPHASLTLNVLYAPFPGAFRPYLEAGGGLDAYLAGGAFYTSRFGYVIEIPGPKFKDRFDLEAHAGIGALIAIGKAWGFRLEGRYGWIFEESRTLSGISGAAALFLTF